MSELPTVESFRAVLKVLEQHRRVLTEARCPPDILGAYSALLKHMARLSDAEIMRLFSIRATREKTPQLSFNASNLNLDQVDATLASESVPRKILEAIAVERFKVPRGSLRSYPTIEKLREKLTTLSQNERAHETIGLLARTTRT